MMSNLKNHLIDENEENRENEEDIVANSIETNRAPPLISSELIQYYESHGVHRINEFLVQQMNRCNNSTSTTCSDHIKQDNYEGISKQDGNIQDHMNMIDNQHKLANGGSRFIRLNTRFDRNETLRLLQLELEKYDDQSSGHITPIPWLPSILDFFAIPNNFMLFQSELFKTGRIYGMDVSSGAAVATLLTNDYDVDVNVSTSTEKESLPRKGKCYKTDIVEESKKEQTLALSSTNTSQFRVLDLCCAPGVKTCAIADILPTLFKLESRNQDLTIIGVDINKSRIQTCKSIVTKYHTHPETSGYYSCKSKSNLDINSDNDLSSLPNIRLYCIDATKLSPQSFEDSSKLIFDSTVSRNDLLNSSKGERKRMNKSARAREKKKLRSIPLNLDPSLMIPISDTVSTSNTYTPSPNESFQLFDRVLVDAECSTDGAIKHLPHKHKFQTSIDSLTINPKLSDPQKLDKLVSLQKELIEIGFRFLKDGGIMIYSTCSLSVEQNENVVSWLLDKYSSTAVLIPVSFSTKLIETNCDESIGKLVCEGSLKGTVRFRPYIPSSSTNFSNSTSSDLPGQPSARSLFGDGFFLAKILKTL